MTENIPDLHVQIARLTLLVEQLVARVEAIGGIDKRLTVMETQQAEAEKHVASIRWLVMAMIAVVIPLAVAVLTMLFHR